MAGRRRHVARFWQKGSQSVTHRKSLAYGLIALALLLAGCGGDDAGNPTSTAIGTGQQGGPNVLRPLATGREVQAEDGRYSFRVPGEWVEYEDPLAELAFRTVAEDPALALNVVREAVSENTRIQAYAEEAREDVGRLYSNVNSFSLTPVRIGSLEAYRWIYSATFGERRRLFYQLFVIEGSEGFVLTGYAPADADPSMVSSTFDGIAGSLTFARG
jgi:hypothetical protein